MLIPSTWYCTSPSATAANVTVDDAGLQVDDVLQLLHGKRGHRLAGDRRAAAGEVHVDDADGPP